jgi:apolipoprotein N-acyltransferase
VLGPGVVPVLDTPYGRLATVICYDANFPSLVRQAGRQGADILLVPSSDWAEVTEPLGRTTLLRVVENGTALVRPTRKGDSFAVDHQGRVLAAKRDWFTGGEQTMLADVPTEGASTVYARLGDGLPWLSIIGLLWAAGLALTGWWRRRVR